MQNNTILVFPGQGSQTPGMAAAFMEHPHTRELFQEIDDALSFNLSRLMKEGPDAELTETHNAQPALLAAGLAAVLYLYKQSGKTLPQLAAALAGHSLGEYTAVTAAGGLPVATAAQLVRLRGQAMSRAVPTGQGGMSAVLGLDVHQLEPFVAEINAAEALRNPGKPSPLAIANDNASGQLILSGLVPPLMEAEDAARGIGAKRVLRLNVSGPFHTPLMAPAASEVVDFLKSHPLQPLGLPVWANVTAQPVQESIVATQNLAAQITGRVRWRETMQNAAAVGITQVVELGVGKVLSGLAPRCDARLQAQSLSSPAEIDAWLESQS